MDSVADDLRIVACRLPAAAVRELAPYADGSLARLRAAALLRGLGLEPAAIGALLDPADAGAWSALSDDEAGRLRTAAAVHDLLCPSAPPECGLRRLPARLVVRLRVRAPAGSVDRALTEAREELVSFVRAAEMTVAGPFAATFLGVVSDHADVECALPVEELVGSSGRVAPGHDPGGVFATTVHAGDLRTLPRAYDALAAWMTERGHPMGGPAREVYLPDGRVQVCLPAG